MIKIIDDNYNGVIVDFDTVTGNIDDFKNDINNLIYQMHYKKLLWVKVPINKSQYIPVLTSLGFVFHNCGENSLTLVKKLDKNAILPTTKNFIAGVGAVVINNGSLLVVKEKLYTAYKLPGGHVEKNESIKDALVREVHEETGINVEFESILAMGHFKNGQFDEANIYFVCTAKALSQKIKIADIMEITEARWIDCNEFLNLDSVNNFNKSVVQAALNNNNLKLINRQIQLRLPNNEVFF